MNKPLALVIEDDPDLSEIFSITLRSSGFETEVFQDGQAALNRLAGTPPAVILLDLHLPRVTGATILQNIRANERFAKTSVIVATADARQAAELQVQADLVLLKPVGVDQLRELAKRMLQLWNATDAPAK
jgi:two-component system, OmpR family, alkaline phosphatase synthesis response regulator PhoP